MTEDVSGGVCTVCGCDRRMLCARCREGRHPACYFRKATAEPSPADRFDDPKYPRGIENGPDL